MACGSLGLFVPSEHNLGLKMKYTHGIWLQEIMAFIRSYVVPEGFPDSVTPSYVPYMTWRALKVYCRTYIQQSAFTAILKNRPKFNVLFTIQHFFGGAMGVFTTRTLLSSVGVSQSKVTPGAIAINWILKVKTLYHFRSFPFSCSQY
jgi:hypothetical protein